MRQIARFLQFLEPLFPILINSFTDGLRFLQSLTARRAVLAAENLFLRKQLAFYQEHQIRLRRLTGHSSVQPSVLVAVLRLEKCSGHRQTRNPDRLAPQGIQALLEGEVSTRAATHSCTSSSADRRDGSGESDLGTSTHRR